MVICGVCMRVVRVLLLNELLQVFVEVKGLRHSSDVMHPGKKSA